MLKIRCDHCTRLIVCDAVKDEAKNFCADGCRENWKRSMRRFQAHRKPLLSIGDP